MRPLVERLQIKESLFDYTQEIFLRLRLTKESFEREKSPGKLTRFECAFDEIALFLEKLQQCGAILAYVIPKPATLAPLLGSYLVGYWHTEEIEMEVRS